MSLTKTPICNFNEKAKDFNLISTDKKKISLADITGKNGTLVIFICNHCPYVKAVIKNIVDDVNYLKKIGIKSVAIMSNDIKNYPEDSFENMISFSKKNKFTFPYLLDETQQTAINYKAVCTPDFFGYNKKLGLQYRGRIRELKNLKIQENGQSDLINAMELIAKTDNGPKNQIPSMGCNIKWIK